MTTIYVPVLIESAEQAEALPPGTIAILDDDTLPVALHVTKSAEHLMPWRNGKHVGADENVVGAQALVPIEAEEEWKTLHEGAWHLKADEDDARRDANALGARRRYTTDWEEA